jgi:alkylation response protein AidB-like acyl-CoA dehydrogenase
MPYTELNLEISDEHIALKENAHKFAVEVLRPAAIELDTMTPEQVIAKGSIYWDCMKKMYENGYHTVLIPDEYGGLGVDPLGIHIVFEEIAYGSVGFAVSIGVACFSAFYASLIAEDNIINKFILPYVNCKDASIMSCWAITEPDHGSDILMPFTDNFHNPKITQQVKATKKGNKYLLNGQKAAWVSNGTTASMALLFFGTDASLGMAGGGIAIADLNDPGVSRGKPLEKIGQRDLPQGEIYFDDVRVPKERIFSLSDSYEQMTDLVLGAANAHMAIMCLGGARAAFEETLNYTKERFQGGKLLCEHQDIQRRLADMFINIEAARQLSRNVMTYNLWNFPPNTTYSMCSKIFCSRVAFDVAQNAFGEV